MDQLEFALIPIGIVLGYGITLVLGAWSEVIRHWGQSSTSAVLYLSATSMTLFFLYLNFSGLWAYQNVVFVAANGVFNVFYLFATTLPILLIMLSVSVLTQGNEDKLRDLEQHYFDNSRRFFSILSIALLASFGPDFIPGVPVELNPIPALFLISLLMIMAFSKHRILHMAIHALMWLLLMVLSALYLSGFSFD